MHGKNLSQFIEHQIAQDPELPKRLRRLNVYFNVAFRIANMRKRRGLTQTELAKLLGTTQPNIARWETPGYTRYSLSRLIDMAEALNTTLELRFVERFSFFDRISWQDGERMVDLIQDYQTDNKTNTFKFNSSITVKSNSVEVMKNA